MSRLTQFSLVLTLAALLFVAAVPVAMAQETDTFDISVKHNINGRALGLEKELPVDVCVNGGYAFTFEFKDVIETSLPADTYTFTVFLDDGMEGSNCSGDPVMSLGPVPIPAGVDVDVRARLSAGKTPILDAKVR